MRNNNKQNEPFEKGVQMMTMYMNAKKVVRFFDKRMKKCTLKQSWYNNEKKKKESNMRTCKRKSRLPKDKLPPLDALPSTPQQFTKD